MTNTCKRCNNTFGSWTEAAMLDWYDGAAHVIYRRKGDSKPFANGRVLHLRTASGELVMMPQVAGSVPADMREEFQAGREIVADIRLSRPSELENGILKSAYLAAVLHLGGLPDVPSAHEIRHELLAVVEAASRADVTAGAHAKRLRRYRTGVAASGPPLALLRTHDGEPEYLISLAGTVLVEWPFPEVDPTRWEPAG